MCSVPFISQRRTRGAEWSGDWPQVTQQDHLLVSDFLVFSFSPDPWGVWTGLPLATAA